MKEIEEILQLNLHTIHNPPAPTQKCLQFLWIIFSAFYDAVIFGKFAKCNDVFCRLHTDTLWLHKDICLEYFGL